METLFKNHHTRTDSWIKECTLLTLLRSPINIIMTLISLASLVCAVYKMVSVRIIYVNFFSAPILWFAAIVIRYFRLVSITKKRNAELNRKNCQVFTEVTQEGIEIIQGDSSVHIGFASIKRGIKTPNYILLRTKGALLCTFRRDGFMVGNEEDFLRFLREKGIKVK